MILLVGPSASGKTELGKILEKDHYIKKVVTYTTRTKRVGEIDKVDYCFVDKEHFVKLKEEDFFFETVSYNNNFYGTSRQVDNNTYLIVDPIGLRTYNECCKENIISFYLNASADVRKQRMQIRKDNPRDIDSRILEDKVRFSVKDVSPDVDFIIDCDNLNLNEVANEVMRLYKSVK